MSKPKLSKGSPVLFLGEHLTVLEIVDSEKSDGTKIKLAHIHNEEKSAVRAGAVTEFRALRERIVKEADDLSENQKRGMLADLSVLDEKASEALFRLNIRVDLLGWWKEKECWVSNGRIMSDDQRKRWRVAAGFQPAGGHTPWARFADDEGRDAVKERAALLFLESMEG